MDRSGLQKVWSWILLCRAVPALGKGRWQQEQRNKGAAWLEGEQGCGGWAAPGGHVQRKGRRHGWYGHAARSSSQQEDGASRHGRGTCICRAAGWSLSLPSWVNQPNLPVRSWSLSGGKWIVMMDAISGHALLLALLASCGIDPVTTEHKQWNALRIGNAN